MVQEPKANQRIRDALTEAGMPKWKLADLMKIHHSTLSVRLRHEWPEEEQARILDLIDKEIKRKGEENNE